MRIIAGEDRGRTIGAPKGLDARPTTDRVRESVMSAVYSSIGDFSGLRVLDLFAGSGAMGIEALSRGAGFAVFNDISKDSRACVERNLSAIGRTPGQAKVTSYDAFSVPKIPNGPFDLVFLDPPYAKVQQEVFEMISGMARSGAFSDDALIVYEHDGPSDEELAGQHGLSLQKERRHGKTYVSYLTVRRS